MGIFLKKYSLEAVGMCKLWGTYWPFTSPQSIDTEIFELLIRTDHMSWRVIQCEKVMVRLYRSDQKRPVRANYGAYAGFLLLMWAI